MDVGARISKSTNIHTLASKARLGLEQNYQYLVKVGLAVWVVTSPVPK